MYENEFQLTYREGHSTVSTIVTDCHDLEIILRSVMRFLHSEDVGFLNSVTFVIKGRADEKVVECKNPNLNAE